MICQVVAAGRVVMGRLPAHTLQEAILGDTPSLEINACFSAAAKCVRNVANNRSARTVTAIV
jgi:hypothetical protein